jgi:hypothetical protein
MIVQLINDKYAHHLVSWSNPTSKTKKAISGDTIFGIQRFIG